MLADCEVVVEGEYASNPSHNCYAEFHAVVADFSRHGKLTMWTPTQSAVLFQKGIAETFRLSEGNVRMMTLNTGGAFTGRGTLRPHHYLAAALSRKARRPLKIRAYADEEFLMGRAGGRNEYRFRSGAMRDGRLRVIEADIIFDSGAYLEAQTLIPYITASYMHWLHRVEAVRYRGRLVYTNNMPYWIHHGGGIAQMAYAWGQHLDAVAREVGMDPVAFHLHNAVEKGHTTMTGTHFASCGLKECMLGTAALAQALSPLKELRHSTSVDEFLQKHYRELSRAELDQVLMRLERESERRYGKKVHIRDVRPEEGVEFAYALNLSVCVGCRKCAEACHNENNHDRSTNNSYVRVVEMEQGSFDMEKGRVDYDHPVPAPGKYYLPVQCQQCDNAPCVKVCPVQATWKERDGIVVVDYNWCIGCRYCEAACPYHARRFNWTRPDVPPDQINPVV